MPKPKLNLEKEERSWIVKFRGQHLRGDIQFAESDGVQNRQEAIDRMSQEIPSAEAVKITEYLRGPEHNWKPVFTEKLVEDPAPAPKAVKEPGKRGRKKATPADSAAAGGAAQEFESTGPEVEVEIQEQEEEVTA